MLLDPEMTYYTKNYFFMKIPKYVMPSREKLAAQDTEPHKCILMQINEYRLRWLKISIYCNM